MDFKEKKTLPNPRIRANPISQLFFLWLIPLFKKGSKRSLEIDDLYDVLEEDASEANGNRLQLEWEKQKEKALRTGGKPRFYKALIKTFSKEWIYLSLFLIVDEWFIRIAQPIYLRHLIRSFSDGSSEGDKYFYASAVVISSLIHTVIIHPTVFEYLHVGMKSRISAGSLVYRKSLTLSKAAQGKTTIGQLVNILSNDVNRFDMYMLFIPYIYIGPVQTCIFVYFLFDDFGYSCLAGFGFVVLLLPVQYWIGKMFTIYRGKIARKTDERGRIMNEIIIAMRVIKMYAWEKPFGALINRVRAMEVKVLKKSALMRAFYMSLFITSWKIMTYLVFITYILVGERLTAEKVFFCVSIFSTVRQVMISFVPTAAAGIGELIVALTRIESFLLLDELELSKNLTINPENNENVVPRVKIEKVTASWTDDKKTIDNLDLDAEGDRLVMVVGPVGSGKTSLLHLLLAELPFTSGKCQITGLTSYASQEPWIFSGNLKQNILFGLPYDEIRYKETIRVCSLEDDLKQLPFGDMTIVGERGVALSGGQKARVNLARALYQKSNIYLLDDPLSAVDAKVSRDLFEVCIKNYLKGHLRILVTHQLQYLSQADHIVVFDKGRVLAQGKHDELVEKGIDFVSLMAKEDEEDTKRKVSVVDEKIELPNKAEKKEEEAEKPKAQVEKMAGGSVGFNTYWDYYTSAESPFALFMVIFGFVISQAFYSASDYWLSEWTNKEEIHFKKVDNGEESDFDQSFYIWSYSALLVGVFLSTSGRAVHFFMYSMKIAINLHNKMFASLVRAPTKFFDENPSGRVMNRFTKDLGSLDEFLAPAAFDFISIMLLILGFIIIVITSNYYIIAPASVLVVGLYLLRRFYIGTARDVKRIEAITRSPLFTHLAASNQGLTTIRASRSQNILIKQFDGHQDLHSSAWYMFIASNRGFGIWLEFISLIFLACVVFGFLLILKDAPPGDVGLAISSAMSITGVLQWGMRQSAETENLMTSAERALEYVKLDSEASLDSTPKNKPSKRWPERGVINFSNVFLAYEDKDVLKELTFTIEEKEKIGIVGRTGAGKSSIIAALFRMTEPRGDIYLDGVKINAIGLHDLRKSISIIPQEPVLFSGTIRYNLDPFEQFKDDDLWKVLEDVDLKHAVSALDFKVSDGGSNFSVGQRQLVCLARAILRRNRVIVMDEATANVDPGTDTLIQKTIRTKFSECTIITIAHRLHSVMDCDRILVLDNGYLKEYDHPHILLQNPNGLLTSMVSHTGKASSVILRKIAAETFGGRKSFAINENLI